MRSSKIQGFFVCLLAVGIPTLIWAGEPTNQIKQTTDKILSIVGNPQWKDPSKTPERRRLIRAAVDERFDWEEMARRSLAQFWAKRTPEEKKEFTQLYSDLLEKAYMSKVEDYSGEKVTYVGDTIDADYAVVRVKFVTARNTDIPVDYRVRKKGDQWLVYDISIEGVSLVNNYRRQFSSILAQSSYENLIKKLKEKAEEK